MTFSCCSYVLLLPYHIYLILLVSLMQKLVSSGACSQEIVHEVNKSICKSVNHQVLYSHITPHCTCPF